MKTSRVFFAAVFQVLLAASGVFLSADQSTAWANAWTQSTSAVRLPGQGYLDARDSVSGAVSTNAATPWTQRQDLASLRLKDVPSASSAAELQAAFERVRDERDWAWRRMPGFARRIPWLSIADGCFLRATLMLEKLREWGSVLPKEVMVFGDLSATNAYESVAWWHHVAPILKVGELAYVIDPSMDASHPLELSTWLSKMTTNVPSLTLAICSADTVDPNDDCGKSESDWDPSYRLSEIDEYLEAEWDLLQDYLGAEPVELLGDHPPWKGIALNSRAPH